MRRATIGLALLAAIAACGGGSDGPSSGTPPATFATDAPPAARVAALGPGVNVTRWFWLPPSEDAAHFQGYLGDAAIDRMRAMGIRAVRLPVEPRILAPGLLPDQPDEARLQLYVQAVDRLLAHDMRVVVDLHPARDKDAAEAGGEYMARLARLWGILAGRLASRDTDRVVLELLNEPVYSGRLAEWIRYEEAMILAIRAAAPRHTIIVPGTDYSGIDALVARPPSRDRNVVYTFHYYEPFTFTHQGATWVGDPFPSLAGIPFPGTGSDCPAAVDAQPTTMARDYARYYCGEAWDSAKVARRIDLAVSWARTNGVALYAGEFGTYCPAAPPASRARWLGTLRALLDARGIPWATWGWDDCFALGATRRADGSFSVDTTAARALGFTP